MYHPIGNFYVIGDFKSAGDYLSVPLMPTDGSVEKFGKVAIYDTTLEVHESIGVMNDTYATG